jgi:type VI secretion system secreted protein VgrG
MALFSAPRRISCIDPFGNILSKSGPLSDANTYRFSSQEYHQNSGLLLYLRRAYDPNLQRWLNRDPIEEAGGINLYCFTDNDPANRKDLDGLLVFPADFIGPLLPEDTYGPFPLAPRNADVDANISKVLKVTYTQPGPFAGDFYTSEDVYRATWFRRMVKHGGDWDYRTRYGDQFGNFGNFNFGATGTAMGFCDNTLLRMAGSAEIDDHPKEPQPGDPQMLGPIPNPFQSGIAPYGDKPRDQHWIKAGIDYYNSQYPPKSPPN